MKHQSKFLTFFLIVSIASFSLATNLYAQNRRNRQRPNAEQDFYRVIVENNLFRPLGWKKPDQKLQYVLIATLIEPDGKTARAFLMEQRSSQYHLVSAGERIGDSTVEKIEANEISLNQAGKTTTLKADSEQFLSGPGRSKGNEKPGKPSQAKPQGEREEQQARNNNQRGEVPDARSLRDRFRNASPEERQRLIREFQRNRGDGGGGRGRRR
jgi:hypothetical protein